MNALSLQSLSTVNGDYTNMADRFRVLSPRVQREVLSRAIDWGVMHGLAECRCRSMRGMGGLGADAVTSAVQVAVQNAIAPLMPALTEQLTAAVGPAAQKAADVVGPVLDEKLRKYGPIVGVIAGVVAAVLGIGGMLLLGGYIVKKVKAA